MNLYRVAANFSNGSNIAICYSTGYDITIYRDTLKLYFLAYLVHSHNISKTSTCLKLAEI